MADAPHLSKTVSDFEPPLALFGGGDGLEPLRVLLAGLPAFLRSGAPFVFEFGYGQARDVSALVEASGAFRLAAMRLDAAGIPRTATAVRL
jgi:release factor glutamine methyltransferase